MTVVEKVRRNIELLRGQFHAPSSEEEPPIGCPITTALVDKLRAIGYNERAIPSVVRALCFTTYRKKPKKGYKYLLLGVDEFGLVDCGGDYTSEWIPLTIIREVKKRPQESDWKWVYIFDEHGREVLKQKVR